MPEVEPINSQIRKTKNKMLPDGLKVAAISLGCAKNRIDSEEILGCLLTAGFILTDDCRDADLVIINTCSFIEEAQQESVNTLVQTAEELRGSDTVLVVAGCLVEIYGPKIIKNIPAVNGAIGVHSYRHLNKFLALVFRGLRVTLQCAPSSQYCSLYPRLLTRPPYSACVRIAEGCSNRCSYCLIPAIRGSYRSRDPQEITAEIDNLLSSGTREIVLIAQDTTAYGSDHPDYPDLNGLIKLILERKDKFWLRIMYTYPSRIKERLIQQISEDKRICRYLDLPMQHSSDKILALMNRSYRQHDLKLLIDRLREKIPGIALRTTCMVGFPGETKKDYLTLLEDLAAFKFDHLGTFTFSLQEGTAAGNLPGKVPLRIAKRRLNELMRRQQSISLASNKILIGKRLTVLIEGKRDSGQNWYYGRTEFQAPEVDGRVLLFSWKHLKPGDWVSAEIVAASPYNLLAAKTVPLPGGPI